MKARLWHGLWRCTAAAGTRRFARGLQNPRAAQSIRLAAILKLAQGSRFAAEHGLSPETTERDFQTRVPLRTWEDFSPWMEKVVTGQQGVLTQDPIRRLAPTSGSSQGCKLIPTGKKSLAEFNAALEPWLTGLLRDEPALADGCSYWSISPPCAFAQNVRAGFPVGFEDDTAYFGPWAALVAQVQAVPSSVARESSAHRFRENTLAHLLRRPDLRFASIWHPSFLELLLNHLEEHWETLLRTVSQGNAQVTGPLSRGDSRRARALRDAGPRPARIWPQLSVVSAWCDASSAGPAKSLAARLPGVKLIPKGLVATEGIVSIPWRGRHPLAVTSHFLEFLEDSGSVHGAHQLQRGRHYEVVLTTSGGLWRLRTGDMVEVDGFLEATPSIRFLGRKNGTVDLCGEKLNEIHVARCFEALEGFLSPSAWRMLVPALDAKGYLLLHDQPLDGEGEAVLALDRRLRENPHYDLALKLGQLRPLQAELVPPGAGMRVLEKLVALGQAHGSAKPPLLDGREDWQPTLAALG